MKIASSQMQLDSQHRQVQQFDRQESLHAWHTRPQVEARRPERRDLVEISDAGKAAQTQDTQAVSDTGKTTERDPRIQLIKTVIEYLTGKTVKTIDAESLMAQHSEASTAATQESQASTGFGLDYQRHESYSEYESTQFSASGTVKTADGQELSFQLDFKLERYYHEESDTHIQLGDAVRPKDPLVVNFGGTAAQLADTHFRFDLNADGRLDQVNQLLAGSGFLALDHNQNGRIDNGKELFGPTTGDGFSELARLDADQNGWIDESDPSWRSLRVWIPGDNGPGQLLSLAEANVGAISLQTQATPFDLKNSANELMGQVVASSVYLKENGGASTVQQIDLVA